MQRQRGSDNLHSKCLGMEFQGPLKVNETMRSMVRICTWGVGPRPKGAAVGCFCPPALAMALRRHREGVSRAPHGKRSHTCHSTHLYMGAWDHVPRAQQWCDFDCHRSRSLRRPREGVSRVPQGKHDHAFSLYESVLGGVVPHAKGDSRGH